MLKKMVLGYLDFNLNKMKKKEISEQEKFYKTLNRFFLGIKIFLLALLFIWVFSSLMYVEGGIWIIVIIFIGYGAYKYNQENGKRKRLKIRKPLRKRRGKR